MFDLATINNDSQKLSSLDFLVKYINPSRDLMGEPQLRNTELVRKIESECDDIGVMQKFSMTTSQGANREVKGYMLNKNQLMLVGMRESKAVRRTVLEKLKLAFKPTQPVIPQSFSAALLLAAKQAEQIERDAPLVDFAKQVNAAKNGITLGEFAKAVGVGRNHLFGMLRQMQILISSKNEYNNPYQTYIDRGYFEVRQTTYEYHDQQVVANTSLITGRGEIWLTKQLKKHNLIVQ